MKKIAGNNIAFMTKDKPGVEEALRYLRRHFGCVDSFIGKVGDPFPAEARRRNYDICVSYISPWIVPAKVLKNVKEFCINFHPGTPEYRGIGCTNFAIYNGEEEYGITAHIMTKKVDSGRIVAVTRFKIAPGDTVYSVTNKCYKYLGRQFRQVFDHYLSKGLLPTPIRRERWSTTLYTRKALNELCRIGRDMGRKEVTRRIKATTYPGMPGAYVEAGGHRFEYNSGDKR